MYVTLRLLLIVPFATDLFHSLDMHGMKVAVLGDFGVLLSLNGRGLLYQRHGDACQFKLVQCCGIHAATAAVRF